MSAHEALERIGKELEALGSRADSTRALRELSVDLLALRSRVASGQDAEGPCLLLTLGGTDCAVALSAVRRVLPLADRDQLDRELELLEPHPTGDARRTILLLERSDGSRVGLVVDRLGQIVEASGQGEPLRQIAPDQL